MTDLKLGKRPATEDPRDLLFASYAAPAVLPKPPGRFGHGSLFTDWHMFGNGPDATVEPGFQGAGDCVFAGAAHETMLFAKLGKHPVTFTGASVISDYSAVTGYVLDDDSTDQGTDVRTALSYRRHTGVKDAKGIRHTIAAYVKLPLDWETMLQAVWIFGAAGLGFRFPDSAMGQFDRGEIWDVVPGEPDPTEGHYVPLVGSTLSATKVSSISWARRQELTRAFFDTYADELWTFISLEMLVNGTGPHGFNLAALKADLAAI